MKRFLAVCIGSKAATDKFMQLDAATRDARQAEGMQAWGDWATKNAKSIVDNGSPLGKTKRVAPEGVEDIRNAMAAWLVVQAESHDAAVKLFENHPHFTLFPGDSVEVMECIAIPGA